MFINISTTLETLLPLFSKFSKLLKGGNALRLQEHKTDFFVWIKFQVPVFFQMLRLLRTTYHELASPALKLTTYKEHTG